MNQQQQNQDQQQPQQQSQQQPNPDELKAYQARISQLEDELSKMRKQLVDPDYLEYVAAKQQKAAQPEPKQSQKQAESDDEDLPFASKQEVEEIKAALSEIVRSLQEQRVLQEWELLTKQYPDAEELLPQIEETVRTANTNLTLEQAYLIVKAKTLQDASKNKNADDFEGEEEPAAPKQRTSGTEKPGSTAPIDSDAPKEYKTAEEAAMAALNEVRRKYRIRGDRI